VRRSVLILLLLAFFTFFLGLGRQAITDTDEGFYAEAAREMVENGDWLTPYFNYEQRWQKPILYYWLTAATYTIAGVSEAAARWWSARSGAGLVLLTWVAARRMAAHDDAAWLAGAITATCFGYFAIARLALPDLPLAFCITLTIWSALERRWLVAGAAAGLGFLMKGPVAVVVAAIVLGPIWWRERRARPIPVRSLVTAAAMCAAVALPWYSAMAVQHGTEYLRSFFVGDNLERFATDRFNEPRGVGFYVPILIGGMLPWSIYLIAVVAQSVGQIVRRRRRLTDMDWRLFLWTVMPLAFFTISVGKQPRYILPVLPPLAIFLARSITNRIRDTDRRGESLLTMSTWGTAALCATFSVLLFQAKPLFITAYSTLTVIGAMLMTGAAAALVWLGLSRRWERLPATMAICGVVILLSIQFGALAGVRPEPVEKMAALVRAHRGAEEPVGAYRVFVRNLVFYSGFKHAELFDEGRALDFLQGTERSLLVVRADDLPRLEALSGVKTHTLGQVDYVDPANLRLRTLLSPMPAQDIDTVLLVSTK
jgi:4-amino-4-deoxy-L-arabinose transferase-like glycosyltransferase